MSTAIEQIQTSRLPLAANPNFAIDEDGLPIYLGTTEQDYGDDWDSVSESLTRDLWELAAIAATIVTKYGENNVGQFAYDHRTSASWIRKLAKTYRAFQNGMRIAMLSFYHHLEAASAKNPVRAINIANDREMSTRELKRWIYLGECRRSSAQTKELGPAPSKQPEPAVITVDAEAEDQEISILDEVMTDEDHSLLLADIELGLRLVIAATSRARTKFILRYFESLQQELDWELEQLTKAQGKMPERVESLIRGGCWIPVEIMKRAKINTAGELNRICGQLEKQGKVKWSREGKRKHGTAPEMWMPFDMPDGDEFEVQRSGFQADPDVGGEDEEHY